MKKIEKKAYAKVNLMLRVIGKRLDGYHDLQMVNAKIDLYDTVTLCTNDTSQVRVVFDKEFAIQNNIVEKIIYDLKNRYRINDGITVYINKRIPIASGMAGGSADAAAVIHLMDNRYNLNLSFKEKQVLGLKYGADIPYMLIDDLAIVEGIGEVITSVPDKLSKEVLIVNPNFPVFTKEIFQNVSSFSSSLGHAYIYDAIKAGKVELLLQNDLMNVVEKSYPELRKIVNELKIITDKPVFMTGSGPTLVVLLNNEIEETKLNEFKNKYSDIYIQKHKII